MPYLNTQEVLNAIVQWQQDGFRQPLDLKLTEGLTDFHSLQRIFAALLVARAISKGIFFFTDNSLVKLDLAVNETNYTYHSLDEEIPSLEIATFQAFHKKSTLYSGVKLIEKDDYKEDEGLNVSDFLDRLNNSCSITNLFQVLTQADILRELKLQFTTKLPHHSSSLIGNVFDREPKKLRVLDLSNSSVPFLRGLISPAISWNENHTFEKIILRNTGLSDTEIQSWFGASLGTLLEWDNTSFKELDLRDNPLITEEGWKIIASYVCAYYRYSTPLKVLGMPKDLEERIQENAVMNLPVFVIRKAFSLIVDGKLMGPRFEPSNTGYLPPKKERPPAPAPVFSLSIFSSNGKVHSDPEKRPLLKPPNRNDGTSAVIN